MVYRRSANRPKAAVAVRRRWGDKAQVASCQVPVGLPVETAALITDSLIDLLMTGAFDEEALAEAMQDAFLQPI
eukprot:6486979-Amphidinium_carterae.1